MINKFLHGISFSNTDHERDVFIEHCSWDSMYTFDDPAIPTFYLHLPIVYDLGVLAPLLPLKRISSLLSMWLLHISLQMHGEYS